MIGPGGIWAWVPFIDLTDLGQVRVQLLSFFLVGLLGSAWLVQRLWNHLQHDCSRLPRLSYGKALGVVSLGGALVLLLLTLVPRARELLTPGAWEKHRATCWLIQPTVPMPAAPPAETDTDRARRDRLDRLRQALWAYAESHGGQFPATDMGEDLPAELWLASDNPPERYRYVGGQATGQGLVPLAVVAPLVYEPGSHGDRRLVMLTDGSVREMTPEWIAQVLSPERP